VLNNIKLIVYDFDGVMTDNRVIVREDGIESVIVSRADGMGVGIIMEMGIPQVILSSETNRIVSLRAKKLGIPVLQGVDDKKTALLNYCKDNNYNPSGILYVGNDVNDEGVMKAVGYSVATADAHHSIKSLAQMVLDTKGGQGVVRELADKIEGISSTLNEKNKR
jgi:YrbI family 3-deoxy-D-manno-octulosonate 8-phosphate phosphatase